MPQLDTIFISLIFSWTWLMIYSMMKKTSTVQMKTTPKIFLRTKINKQTMTLPWT